MVVLDVAIVNVALPSIRHRPSISRRRACSVITAYSILFGGVLLNSAAPGRPTRSPAPLRRGARGLHPELAPRRARLVRGLADRVRRSGLGAALLSPAALSILTRPSPRAAIATSRSGSGAGRPLAAAAGVLLGGALTSGLSWSWIFFINVPGGSARDRADPFLLRESRAELESRHFDSPAPPRSPAG